MVIFHSYVSLPEGNPMMGLVECRQVHTSLPWEFVPQQRRVVVGLGERRMFQWENHLQMVVPSGKLT